MPLSDASQIGRLTAQAEAMQEDIRDLREQGHEWQRRLRDTETAVSLILEAQKERRRWEERQYRRIEVRLQMLAICAAVASIAMPIAVLLITN